MKKVIKIKNRQLRKRITKLPALRKTIRFYQRQKREKIISRYSLVGTISHNHFVDLSWEITICYNLSIALDCHIIFQLIPQTVQS